jgi:hypothetical protein
MRLIQNFIDEKRHSALQPKPGTSESLAQRGTGCTMRRRKLLPPPPEYAAIKVVRWKGSRE